jgi:hypothetical protein
MEIGVSALENDCLGGFRKVGGKTAEKEQTPLLPVFETLPLGRRLLQETSMTSMPLTTMAPTWYMTLMDD